jgi:UDP-N-acetylglucosamine 2-epimerase (non-hydrolysing)
VQGHPEVVVIFSVHMNPEVQDVVRVELAKVERVHLLEPLDYEPFVQLMSKVYLILTDSGGIQEEAPSLGKPVLVLRNVTERPEGVAAGTLRVVGTETVSIVAAAENLLTDPLAYARMAEARNPYGDGQASKRIMATIAEKWGPRE